MATFANQSSNLSALSSALTSFSELLDVSDDAVSRLTKAENQENAQLFWTTQRRRVDAIDESLLEATEDILPVSHDAKTITEMAELCRIVQEATRQKMGLLRTRLELLGVTTSWNDSITSPPKVGGSSDQRGGSGRSISRKNNNTNNNTQTMIQWSVSVGGPLDCVIEGDVETEGATTPGSLLHPSPLFGGSSSTSKRKTSLTPTTPTMKTFSFSSSTASILEKMSLPMGTPSSSSKRGNRTPRSIKASPSPSSSGTRRRSERHLNFDGFQEEDDMISLNTTMEAAAAAHSHAAGTAAAVSTSHNHPSSNTASPSTTITSQNIVPATAPSPVVKLKEERSQFLARMESMLERVEEELVHETRPSDETSTRKSSSSTSRQPKIMMERPSNSKFLEEIPHEEEEGENDNDDDGDDDSDSVDDDSTNMIATLVAEKPEPMGKDIKRPVPVFFHRPTHIMVDTAGVPSPTHTNITMDATMMIMNDTMISSASVVMHDDDGDNDSTVTPILDRYRLDPDDNSIGVRVVPNQRGQHHQHHDRQHDYSPREEPSHRATATATADAYSKTEFYTDPEGFMSPKGLPGSVSARKTKQYRKTPFPKKQLEQSFDEENHPNMRTALTFSPAAASSTRSTSSSSFDASNPESSFSVPPLRPRSLGQSSRRSTTLRSASLPLRTQSLPAKVAALPKTPEVVVPRAAAAANDSTREWMEKITMAEYNMAPRVVQMQVTREQANQSIDVLQNVFSEKYQSQQPLEFSAPEGYRALQHILDTELRSKSVLMSLCHWKRLLMYRDSGNGMIFAINTFE